MGRLRFFFTFDKHAGLGGPIRIMVITWVRLVQLHQPSFIIIEEIKSFPTKWPPTILQEDILGSHYECPVQVLDPRVLDLTISRPRVYCILPRRDTWSLNRPMTELRSTLPVLAADSA